MNNKEFDNEVLKAYKLADTNFIKNVQISVRNDDGGFPQILTGNVELGPGPMRSFIQIEFNGTPNSYNGNGGFAANNSSIEYEDFSDYQRKVGGITIHPHDCTCSISFRIWAPKQ